MGPAAGAFVALLLLSAVPGAARGAGFDELVRRGAEQLREGRLQEAAESLEEAAEAEPAGEPASPALAEAWAALGLAHVHAGRLAEGRVFLERAAETAPGAAVYHLLLAQALFRMGELRSAREALDRALELDPGGAAARELSGDLYDREGRLNLALGEWEAAAAAGGSHALAAKLARARREMEAEAGMERESSRYFVVRYERDVARPVVTGVFRMLDEAFNALHDLLGDYPREEIPVILYSRVAFRDVTRAPEWMGGLYDGKIRIPVGGLSTVESAGGLLRMLRHEMAHAFLFRMAPAGLPRWFNEGVATTVEGFGAEAARSWLAGSPLEGVSSLDDLDQALMGRKGGVVSAYAAARLALQELEAARGFPAVRRIIAGVGEGRLFGEVFQDEARMSLAEFEERWRRSLP